MNSGKLRGGNIGGKVDSLVGLKDEGYYSDVDCRNLKDKNRFRKVISGDRFFGDEEDKFLVDFEGGIGKDLKVGLFVISVGVKEEVRLRCYGSDMDRNLKLSK